MVAKWKSVFNHIQNKHSHNSELYPECQHGQLTGRDRERQWLKPNSQASVKLEKIILSKTLLKDIAKLSPVHQTSSLEAFHSLILKFAPKHTAVSYLGMLCRLYLAAMHFNENSERMTAVTKDGRPQYSIQYPKFKKGGYSVKVIKTGATYRYASILMHSLFEGYRQSPAQLRDSIEAVRAQVPSPLAASMNHPDKEAAVAAHVSRFRK